MQSPRAITLRRYNNTLKIPVPREFTVNRKLGERDFVMWTEEADGSVKLKFVRLAELEQFATTAA
jgi:hypothetical protein